MVALLSNHVDFCCQMVQQQFFIGPDMLVPLLVVAACRRATCGGGIFQFQGCFSVTVTFQEWACSSIEAP